MTQPSQEPLERFLARLDDQSPPCTLTGQRTLLPTHFERLVRDARELESLKSCLAFLCGKDGMFRVPEPNGDERFCCPEGPAIVALARHLGWEGADVLPDFLRLEHEERGATLEREQVVSWLRRHGFRTSSFVDDIEAGEHLKP
jgi:hypothetical protein